MKRTETIRIQAGPDDYKLLDAVALNASASARTIQFICGRNWSKALIWFFLDRSAATNLTATFEASPDGTVFFPRQAVDISSGTATLSPLTYNSGTISADLRGYIEADVKGIEAVRMAWAGASGGANDLLDVYVTLIAGD